MRTYLLIAASLFGTALAYGAPAAPRWNGAYHDGGEVGFGWDAPPLRNPERIRSFRIYRAAARGEDGEKIAELPVTFARKLSFRERLPEKKRFFYSLAAVDADGVEGARSAEFEAALLPDLSLRQGERVSLNPDLATGKMYPVAGETVKYSATVRNRGAAASLPCRVDIALPGREKPLEKVLPALAPGASHTVEWEFRPERRGEFSMRLCIDPDRKNEDLDRSDNQLTVRAGAVERDVYFMWYGDVTKLPFANQGQCNPNSVAEWHRRGGLAIAGVGAAGEVVAQYVRRSRSADYDGISIDEICAWGETARNVAKALPEYRKAFPDRLVAVWTIGEATVPQIAELVKNGTISLLMFEVYVKPKESNERILKAIENVRAMGIAERSLIGLVTQKDWSNWVGPEEHAAAVIAQMRLIREKAPEIPGFAFWSDDALPGVAEAVDAECYRLFVQPENKERSR